MPKYHESSTGRVVQCRASVKACPRGEAPHGNTKEEVYAKIEEQNSGSTIPSGRSAKNPVSTQTTTRVSAEVSNRRMVLQSELDEARKVEAAVDPNEPLKKRMEAFEEVYRAKSALSQYEVMNGYSQYRPSGFESYPDTQYGQKFSEAWETQFGEIEEFERQYGVFPDRVKDILLSDKRLADVLGGNRVVSISGFVSNERAGTVVANVRMGHYQIDRDSPWSNSFQGRKKREEQGRGLDLVGIDRENDYCFYVFAEADDNLTSAVSRYQGAVEHLKGHENIERLQKSSETLRGMREGYKSPLELYGYEENPTRMSEIQRLSNLRLGALMTMNNIKHDLKQNVHPPLKVKEEQAKIEELVGSIKDLGVKISDMDWKACLPDDFPAPPRPNNWGYNRT